MAGSGLTLAAPLSDQSFPRTTGTPLWRRDLVALLRDARPVVTRRYAGPVLSCASLPKHNSTQGAESDPRRDRSSGAASSLVSSRLAPMSLRSSAIPEDGRRGGQAEVAADQLDQVAILGRRGRRPRGGCSIRAASPTSCDPRLSDRRLPLELHLQWQDDVEIVAILGHPGGWPPRPPRSPARRR
jgi:hypothetical protein